MLENAGLGTRGSGGGGGLLPKNSGFQVLKMCEGRGVTNQAETCVSHLESTVTARNLHTMYGAPSTLRHDCHVHIKRCTAHTTHNALCAPPRPPAPTPTPTVHCHCQCISGLLR